MKKIIGPLLLVILIVGVLGAIGAIVWQQVGDIRAVEARGLVGSEKLPFFSDEGVQDEFKSHGLVVIAEKAGSREIATHPELEEYDFGFPAGVPAAEKMRQERGIKSSYNPFFTPMAIASWQPIAQILEANGVAQDQGGYYTLDMAKLLEMIKNDVRWSDLENNDAYSVNKSVLVNSTDVRKSNSAAMYLSLASYVANGNNIVQSNAEMQQVLPLMEDLFFKQGYVEHSSQVPFEDYLVMGMGKAPMVMIYEAQFISAAVLGNTTDDMVLMYPEPTIFSKHILVPLTENGERVGELLGNDAELQKLVVEYGFRNDNMAYFRQFVNKHNLKMPDSIVNVVEPPSYEILEGMIQVIEAKYTQ